MRYTKEHEWVRLDGDVATIGVSAYAVEKLGDVTFVELPEIGRKVEQFGEIAVIESVKAASDVYSPVSGEVIEINSELEKAPKGVNDGPETGGWFAKLRVSNPQEIEHLMDADAYAAFLKGL